MKAYVSAAVIGCLALAWGGLGTVIHPIGTLMSTAEAASKLGDLKEFSKIATDVLQLIDKGDLPGAKLASKTLRPHGTTPRLA